MSIKEIVNHLKSESNMPMWRKCRLCLIVIVEGILLCRNHPVKPSAEVVEMVKDVDFFLNYPWGRHSFTRLLRMVKLGRYLPTTPVLLSKLIQSSMAVHGFPLAIQLFAFKYVPLLLKYLPHWRDLTTFVDTSIVVLPKCKSYHTSNIFDVENDPELFVMSPKPRHYVFLTASYCDPKVKHLESLIAAGFQFMKETWCGGDSLIPHLLYAQKRKLLDQCRSSDLSNKERSRKKYKNAGRTLRKVEDVDSALEEKLMTFKASLMAMTPHIITGCTQGHQSCYSLWKPQSTLKSYACLQNEEGGDLVHVTQPTRRRLNMSFPSHHHHYMLIQRGSLWRSLPMRVKVRENCPAKQTCLTSITSTHKVPPLVLQCT
ncbi:PREDICTED: uncharacterized protein LOC104763203 isoform X1 [Camelina sativa]|uniref:Uncharacterized protein LOC104763203 isoform X1 n=1 Tax=Camelina sativa TaxID=90675 RepID=A0ABM1R8R3_CAMSA|nr:PREDICTED: uncharacterized protein LOC104763203 isoform X1 [Camelina sativa]XP_019095401.1 PREDICTED: uncharacterized protein LOC104763203 isoform X1 [Camelina sativa]XP_019095402.1 PREDICTED: uncharacterized protein LOC104763203 isoform X1 [Camelina sativa]